MIVSCRDGASGLSGEWPVARYLIAKDIPLFL